MFKKMRGIRLSYITQGLIYFTCRDYQNQPLRIQEKINNLCMEIGGGYYAALREVLISDKSIRQISLEHYLSEALLYLLRKKFYEKW